MRNTSGKAVNNTWIGSSTACEYSSTGSHTITANGPSVLVQALVIRCLTLVLHPQSSTIKSAYSDLSEHIFYPLSTDPIINTTKNIS